MMNRDLKALVHNAEQRGFELGIKVIQQRMLSACKNGTPIDINGRAYFIESDLKHLYSMFADVENKGK